MSSHTAAPTAPTEGAAVRIVRALTWPGLMIASLGLYGTLTGPLALAPEIAIQLQFFALFFGILLLERRFPYEQAWNRYDRQAINDFAYNFLFPAAQFVATSAALYVATLAGSDGGGGPFAHLADLPLVAQVLAFALVAELLYYGYHRLFHEVERLWNFHALHHSSLQLHILNNARVHPVEVFVAFFPIVAAAYLLQVPPDVLGWFLVLQLTSGLLTHSNVAMRNGWISWLFNTPELHHWHHSRTIAEQNNNYSSTLMIWDQVFGTYHNPQHAAASRDIGTGTPIPGGLLRQIAFPFHPHRVADDLSDSRAHISGERP